MEQWPASATIILPIATFPKEPLLDFQISIDSQPAYRLSRKDTARLKVEYMTYLADLAGLHLRGNPNLRSLLAAIFAFRPTTWDGMRKWHCFKRPLWTYLKKASPLIRDHDAYKKWKKTQKEIESTVKKHVVGTYKSAAQNPLLALPDLLTAQPLVEPGTVLEDLNELLTKAKEAIATAPEGQVARAAEKLLSTYSAYGWRWEAITVCTVPLNKPFTIRVKEKRSIDFDAPKRDDLRVLFTWPRDRLFPRARHYISFRDAASNYVHISAPDNSVRLVKLKCRAFSDTWKKLPTARMVTGSADDERKSEEYYSRYDSSESRSERIWIECRLSQTALRSALHWGIVAITISAIWLLLFLVYTKGHTLDSRDVATILLPATFAATLLLATDTTTLARRVKRVKQFLLLVALIALWGVSLTLYINGHVSVHA
ncbi:hypothetical protein [Streptomyces lydicus]|uniref:hypothetical protein n=1 Tax=Streptomyces lydicus TaxID=47763 RepID=UPI0036DFBF68